MGIKIPPTPNPIGDDNPTCYPITGTTPSVIYAAFSGIIRGPSYEPGMPSPPNGTYTLRQDPLQPPFYRFDGTIWLVYYHSWYWADPKRYNLAFRRHEFPTYYAFNSDGPDICKTFFNNEPANPPTAPYIEGICQMFL